MVSKPTTIAELYDAHDDAIRQRDRWDGVAREYRALIEAAERLRTSGIELPGARSLPVRPKSPEPVHVGKEVEKLNHRDAVVLGAIMEKYRHTIFTVPDLDRMLKGAVKKRSIKRALDDMIRRGEVAEVEAGFKRKATKYRLLKQNQAEDTNTEKGGLYATAD